MHGGQFRQFNAGTGGRGGRRGQNANNAAAQAQLAQQQAAAAAAAAQQAQAQAQAQAEMAKRRSQKPTDKNMPEGIENCIPDGELVEHYNKLRNYERRLDATITRKRLDALDSVNRYPKYWRTLRIWISNTVEDQPWQQTSLNVDSFDFSSTVDSTYKVKIQARLLADDMGPESKNGSDDDMGSDVQNKGDEAMEYHLPHFFRAMNVEFPQSYVPEQTVEWKRPDLPPNTPSYAPLPEALCFDELSFRRNGDDNMNITINLTRHEEPERYLLSPELADIVDMTEGTRQEVAQALYEYISYFKLQEDEERRNFRCDDLLRKIVNSDVGHIPMLGDYITPQLKPLPPISLPYTIRVDKAFHSDPTPSVYDVRVLVEPPVKTQIVKFISHPSYAAMLREVSGLDEQLASLIQAISVSKAKRTFFMSLANDPVNFLRKWISSQQRDLEVISGQTIRGSSGSGADTWRKGGQGSVWTTSAAQESVSILLSKQPRHR
ncbi:SWIB/MDM2 domain-containing protein [Ceratocystis lukuohia]|uniref:SWIB/MDM2 domain-containing protein n=1 Tax=Ceratocystis lukuohia TaxID=2019550 RepID=A0ABR4ML88_9PEZI